MPRFMYPAAVEYVDFLNKAGDDIHDAYEEGYADGMRDAVKHGYWKGKPLAGYSTVRCSVCGHAFLDNSGKWKHCPDCGSRMDLEVATE